MLDFLTGGNIQIIPEKTNFNYGETITGKIILNLKKPKNARGLYVVLIGERRNMMGSKNTNRQRICELPIPIDTEKLYNIGTHEYSFNIQIPQENKIQGNETAAAVMQMAQSVGDMFSPIRWFIEVKLDIPKAFDIRKVIPINVTRGNNTNNQNTSVV